MVANVLQGPVSLKESTAQMEFPMWVQVMCWIVLAVFVMAMLYGVYNYCLKTLIAKRKVVEAKLISKVKEDYREIRVTNARNAGIKSPAGPVKMAKDGVAYRLYFDIKGKSVELDVTKDIFDSYKEDTVGLLDYKGNYFYDFKVQ